MNLEEEVFKIGKQLEKIVGQDGAMDSDSAVDLLKRLKDLPITLEVLQKTRIGMSVNTLRKKSENSDLQTQAKSLIKSWKKLLPEKSGGKSEETNGDRKTPNSDKSSRSSSPAQSTTKSSNSAPTTPQDNKVITFPPPKVTGDSVRGRCREMIVNSLKVQGEFEATITPEDFAAACEECIFLEFRDTNMKYKARVRSRVSNLRDAKNPLLKVKVLSGQISPEKFATMPTEDMASEEMKQFRQECAKEGIREAQVSKNQGTETDLFKCAACGGRRTTYTQLQTRSADEPMTTFVLCLDCGKRWKFC
ncbi:Transcription elongation factor A protein 1 [Desmophyllum pertusum]|uniref:Transcription elongation factor n=1 Tax=Desmophyllum pertusum TaxID=174260 RepID=A0A9X0CSS3_9CNID|nr:Transcription elongation factor A protein 1 [Desmophyllum pertusum]